MLRVQEQNFVTSISQSRFMHFNQIDLCSFFREVFLKAWIIFIGNMTLSPWPTPCYLCTFICLILWSVGWTEFATSKFLYIDGGSSIPVKVGGNTYCCHGNVRLMKPVSAKQIIQIVKWKESAVFSVPNIRWASDQYMLQTVSILQSCGLLVNLSSHDP